MSEDKSTLALRGVTKRYDEFTAVNDLSLRVRPGRVFGLIGPNGAGKTTTIRMIVNITVPDEGEIELFGQRDDGRAAGPHRLPARRARPLQEDEGRAISSASSAS